jgi:hypothetical protein
MSKTSIFLLIAIITGFASLQTAKAVTSLSCETTFPSDTCIRATDSLCTLQQDLEQAILPDLAPPDPSRKKKIVSALFALPFPCGFMGAHRVMLGTSPWIPVVYVATFGGCFGLLPLIDFCFITFSKDISPYENNPHVFMWIK